MSMVLEEIMVGPGVDAPEPPINAMRITTRCAPLDALIDRNVRGIVEWVVQPGADEARSVIFDNLLASAQRVRWEAVLMARGSPVGRQHRSGLDLESLTRLSPSGPRSGWEAIERLVDAWQGSTPVLVAWDMDVVTAPMQMALLEWRRRDQTALRTAMREKGITLHIGSSTIVGGAMLHGHDAFADVRVLIRPGAAVRRSWGTGDQVLISVLEAKERAAPFCLSLWVDPARGIDEDRAMWDLLLEQHAGDPPICSKSGTWGAVRVQVGERVEVVNFNGQGLTVALTGHEDVRQGMRDACRNCIQGLA